MTRTPASFRVRETAGLRRFLYPITGRLSWDQGHQIGVPRIQVVERPGEAIPCQVDPIERWDDGSTRSADVTFPVSIGPGDVRRFRISQGESSGGLDLSAYDDPITLDIGPDTIRSRQKQVAFTFDRSGRGLFRSLDYSGMSFIAPGGRGLGIRTADGREYWADNGTEASKIRSCGPLAAGLEFSGHYFEDRSYRTSIDLTALKSWAHVRHTIDPGRNVRKTDLDRTVVEILIDLRLAVQSRVMYDAGVGGWVYGALDSRQSARIDFEVGRSSAAWEFSTRAMGSDAQVEARGCATSDDARSSQWFHWLDHPKALAVAIPTPSAPGRVSIEIDGEGGIKIGFRPDRVDEAGSAPINFGAVFHFLQDLPHISARTNPQSILVPPLLEVEAVDSD